MRRFLFVAAASILATACTKESNLIPVASLSGPASIRVAVPAAFDAAASGDADGSIASYAFDFGDASAPVTGTTSLVNHAFAAAGSFRVTLTVTDNKGAIATAQRDVTVTANQAPIAVLSAPSSGRINRPFTVDASASRDLDGAIASFSFDFGDQTAAVTGVSSATHVYTTPGVYVVGITVLDNDSASGVAHAQVAIADNIAPLASFSAPSSSVVGQSASFDSSLSTDTDGTIVSRTWDFGDGGTSTLAAPVHTYASAATRTVTLTVTDNEGKTATSTRQVLVMTGAQAAQVPTASFTSAASVRINAAAFFDASASTAPGSASRAYAWNFGDGATGTGVALGHTYTTAGTYVVSLTLTATYGDGSTNPNTVTRSITVTPNQAPNASFTGPTSARFSTNVAFDGSASGDADGRVVTWSFDFGDATVVTSASPVANHTYAAAGTYTVTLIVTDNDNTTATASRSILITPNAAPVAALTAPAGGRINRAVLLDASASRDNDGTITTYAFNFGDGSPIVSGASSTASHVYVLAGSYTTQVTVTDNDNATGTAVRAIVIAGNQPPVASFSGPTGAVVGINNTYDASASFDPDGSILTYAWTFGDGTSATGASVNKAWATATPCAATSLCSVTLTVTDNEASPNALNATMSRQVTIYTAAQAGAGPVAVLDVPGQVLTNAPVDFVGTNSSGGSGTLTNFAFDFGDASPVASSLSSVASHAYVSAGTYVAKLTVTSTYSDGSTRTNVAQRPVTALVRQVLIGTISPPTGNRSGGTTVLITGQGFTDPGSTSVSFGANAATILAVIDPTQMRVLTPAGNPGAVNVTVTNPNGSAVAVGGFSYLGGANQADTSFCWVDASVAAGGTSVGFAPNDDDVNLGNAATALPFAFNFFGRSFGVGSRMRVTSNGWMSFTNLTAAFNNLGAFLPNGALPENLIAPYFSDQNISNGFVATRTTGVAPNRTFTVQWDGVRGNSTGDVYRYEASLLEDSDDIKIQYRNPNIYTSTSAGQEQLIGIQNENFTDGVTGLNNMFGTGIAPGGRTAVFQNRGGFYSVLTDDTLNVSISTGPGTRVSNGGNLFAVLSKSINPTTATANGTVFVTDTTTATSVPINLSIFGTSGVTKDGLSVTLAGPVTAAHTYTLTVQGGAAGVKDGLGSILSQDPMGSGACPTVPATNFVLPFNAAFSQAFRIPLNNAAPFGITSTPDSSRVFVTRVNDNRVSEIASATRTVTSTTALPGGASGPVSIVATGNTDRLAIADVNTAQVTKFDITASPAAGVNTTTGAAASPYGITVNNAVTPTRLYTASMDNRVVSMNIPATGAFTTCAIGGGATNELNLPGNGVFGESIAMRSGGTQYYVANDTRFLVINALACGSATGDTLASNIRLDGVPGVGGGANVGAHGMVTTATREYVSLANANRVAVFDAAGAFVTNIPVGASPRGMAITPDGLTLLVALSNDTVAQIDLGTNAVTGSAGLTPGCSPEQITTLTTGAIPQAWVTCTNDNSISILQ